MHYEVRLRVRRCSGGRSACRGRWRHDMGADAATVITQRQDAMKAQGKAFGASRPLPRTRGESRRRRRAVPS